MNVRFPALSLVLLAAVSLPALAQTEKPTPTPPPPPANTPKTPTKPNALDNPLPPDKSIEQTVVVNGKTLHYTATVGTIALTGKDGKPTGEVVYTSYTLDGPKDANRPVTFAFNGGPGASSVFLNMGAIGPKRIAFGNAGDSLSAPAIVHDNPNTWLDFTDLVFIDPIGTGFSRSLLTDDAQTKKLFYSTTPDIEYLSLVIYKWLVNNDRLLSKKYLIGESYGGFRGPRITHYLQTQLGIGVNGLFLVSPYLNPDVTGTPTTAGMGIDPVEWMMTLPSIAAAHLESEGKLTPEAMQPVIAYTEGDYATALIKGPEDQALTDAMIQHVAAMTGLDPQFVRFSGGRLDTSAYLREVHREKGEIGSVYDSNVTAPDPFPYSPWPASSDPILEASIAPTTQAMVNFITNTVGWKTDARYYTLDYAVNKAWDFNSPELQKGSVPDLREALAADPDLRVQIFHGWNDLSCPFMGSLLTQNELPPSLASQLQVHEFPGGHMFYTRDSNGAQLHSIAEATVDGSK